MVTKHCFSPFECDKRASIAEKYQFNLWEGRHAHTQIVTKFASIISLYCFPFVLFSSPSHFHASSTCNLNSEKSELKRITNQACSIFVYALRALCILIWIHSDIRQSLRIVNSGTQYYYYYYYHCFCSYIPTLTLTFITSLNEFDFKFKYIQDLNLGLRKFGNTHVRDYVFSHCCQFCSDGKRAFIIPEWQPSCKLSIIFIHLSSFTFLIKFTR